MPWGWTDAIVVGFQWQDLAVLNIFAYAVWERVDANDQGPSRGGSTFASSIFKLAIGDNVQDTHPTPTPGVEDESKTFELWQYYIEILLETYLTTGFDPATVAPVDVTTTFGADNPPYTYTLSSALAAAGYAVTAGWRRDTRRQVAGLSAVTDTEGNPAVIGQRAECGGFVYEYDGTSWTGPGPLGSLPPGTLADYLSSESASPNHAVPGHMRFADFIDWWIFAQLRDVMRLMADIIMPAAPPFVPGLVSISDPAGLATSYTRDANDNSAVSFAAAKAAADADWLTSYIPGLTLNAAPYGFTTTEWVFGVGPADWNATISQQGRTIQVLATPNTPKTVEFWQAPCRPLGLLPADGTNVFDGAGYAGMTDTALWKSSSVGPGSVAATVDDIEFPDHTIKPPWAGDPTGGPPDPNDLSRGFSTLGNVVIFRMQYVYA